MHSQAQFPFPSLTGNCDRDMVVGFSEANFHCCYISAFYSYHLADGTTPVYPVLLREGRDLYGDDRWGDYSCTSLDPNDGISFWTVQEFATHPIDLPYEWSTYIGRIPTPP